MGHEQGRHLHIDARTEVSDLSPSDVLVDLMQDFIQQQQMAPDYLTFLKKKAEIARDELAAEQGLSEEDVEYEFAARRAAATAKIR